MQAERLQRSSLESALHVALQVRCLHYIEFESYDETPMPVTLRHMHIDTDLELIKEFVKILSPKALSGDLILFRQLIRLAEKCGSLNTVRLCCLDTCCNSGTLHSMIEIDRPIRSTIFKTCDKSKSSRVIHSSHYEERKI